MVSERPKKHPHMINDAGRELTKEETDALFNIGNELKKAVQESENRQERELIDKVMKFVIERITDKVTYDAIIWQLEESYNIKIDKTDLTPQMIQEEIVNSLYREHSHPHIKNPNQNDHIYNKLMSENDNV